SWPRAIPIIERFLNDLPLARQALPCASMRMSDPEYARRSSTSRLKCGGERSRFEAMDWQSLRGDITFAEGAEPGPLAVEIGAKIRNIPGWLTTDDLGHFALILRLQSAFGLRGDIVEIGTYYGRSAAALAHFLEPGEQLVLCDLFHAANRDHYP